MRARALATYDDLLALPERVPGEIVAGELHLVPDWSCEVLSPGNAAHDRVTKRRLYARHRVPYYWLVDPQTCTLEALRLEGELWVETGSWGEGDLARVEPFGAIELDVGRLFVPTRSET